MKSPAPTKPLSSEELARDAEQAGVGADESTESGSDPHLPASESDSAAQGEGKRPPIERGLLNLPPG